MLLQQACRRTFCHLQIQTSSYYNIDVLSDIHIQQNGQIRTDEHILIIDIPINDIPIKERDL